MQYVCAYMCVPVALLSDSSGLIKLCLLCCRHAAHRASREDITGTSTTLHIQLIYNIFLPQSQSTSSSLLCLHAGKTFSSQLLPQEEKKNLLWMWLAALVNKHSDEFKCSSSRYSTGRVNQVTALLPSARLTLCYFLYSEKEREDERGIERGAQRDRDERQRESESHRDCVCSILWVWTRGKL